MARELRRPELDPAEERLRVRDRRRPRERSGSRQVERDRAHDPGAQSGRGRAEEEPERRARDPVDRLRLVGVAAQGPRDADVVQDERDADDRSAVRERPLERDPEPPAPGRRRLEERVGVRGAHRVGVACAEERRWPPVQDGLGSADDDHGIRIRERRVDAKGPSVGSRHLDEPRIRGRETAAPLQE